MKEKKCCKCGEPFKEGENVQRLEFGSIKNGLFEPIEMCYHHTEGCGVK